MEIWSKGHLIAHIDMFGEHTHVLIMLCAPDDSDFGWYDAEPQCNFDREDAECLPDDCILAHIATQVCAEGVHSPTVFVTVPALYKDTTFWKASHIAHALVEGKELLAKRAEAQKMTWDIPGYDAMQAALLGIGEQHCEETEGVHCLS